jgi:hypothetical protein
MPRCTVPLLQRYIERSVRESGLVQKSLDGFGRREPERGPDLLLQNMVRRGP